MTHEQRGSVTYDPAAVGCSGDLYPAKSHARQAFGVFAYHAGLREPVWVQQGTSSSDLRPSAANPFPQSGSLPMRAR